ncbi:MAG: hypothetical protein ACI9PY_003822 [Ascidiaceihabitans sp.]|jgi:hypothetical protein
MSKTESNSRVGGAMSPAQDVKQAMTGFVNDFKGFQADIQTKLQ